jgi:transcriptional regulator with XRE-family HTH domain
MPRTRTKALKTRVRSFLATRNMTQRDLAAMVDISGAHLSTILSRRENPSLSLAVKLETITGIPARDFVAHR